MQKSYSQEFKDTLLDFYHSGQSVTQLSKEYGLQGKTVTIIGKKTYFNYFLDKIMGRGNQ
ncbi:hypothetical protein FNJ53_13530 [Lactococcus lactis]|uniref:Transposase n=2 Tax=Lactococcus TaxID=1357 RepID=T0VIW0_LACLC|nr:hypothetical protein [Lactococcus lactis]EQC95781.1 hypothetical protein LLT3_02675 [Lactococcus cremoris subsp. cremoris TIFN3]EQC95782.1 hypothetical protein LLT3_02680 [Lactococcus cremoris subsp. cremoris TIFN3]TRW71515.1 hypothetical protein FNJ53_13530 [Lactococcus lactis]